MTSSRGASWRAARPRRWISLVKVVLFDLHQVFPLDDPKAKGDDPLTCSRPVINPLGPLLNVEGGISFGGHFKQFVG